MKKELSKKQIREIEEIDEKYGALISIESDVVSVLDKEIEDIKKKRKLHSDKIAEFKRLRSRDIVAVKDAVRHKKYKSIVVKEDDVFLIEIEAHQFLKFGSYGIYNHNDEDVLMSIRIEGESITQYRMYIDFSNNVSIQNQNSWNYRRESVTNLLRCNMKMLNLKDFLLENSKGFKRDFKITSIID